MSRKAVIGAVIFSVVLFRCASQDPYRMSMFEGRHALDEGEYRQAQQAFLKAAQASPDARSYAYAATASYKAGDLAAAQRSIEEAAKLDGKSYSYLRIVGYKALILLGQGKEGEGLDALAAYLAAYENAYPVGTIGDVKRMSRTRHVNLPLLERLLDEQISTYENELEQFWGSGTGWYGQRIGNTGGVGTTN